MSPAARQLLPHHLQSHPSSLSSKVLLTPPPVLSILHYTALCHQFFQPCHHYTAATVRSCFKLSVSFNFFHCSSSCFRNTIFLNPHFLSPSLFSRPIYQTSLQTHPFSNQLSTVLCNNQINVQEWGYTMETMENLQFMRIVGIHFVYVSSNAAEWIVCRRLSTSLESNKRERNAQG